MTIVDSLTADVLTRTRGDADALRQIIKWLDRELNVGRLERTMRLWDISAAQFGVMFGVSRQAMAKWLSDGPPAIRRDQVALLDQSTDLLDRWIKRDRIPAVVRRNVDSLDGRTRLDVALAGEFESLRDELTETFDVSRVAP